MEGLEQLKNDVEKIKRTLWGENGHKGLIVRQDEDEGRFNELFAKYVRAIMYLETIVNFGKWVIRIGMGIVTLIGAVKYKEIWQWFTGVS